MTGRQLLPIQPRPSPLGEEEPEPDPESSRHRRTRPAVLVACEPCRRLKSKCDGERPSCRRCRNKGQECIYELPQDAISRSSARKEIANRLQRENDELRQLFHDISRRPEAEAFDVFQRLRLADDPIALALSIRQAELLLPDSIPEELAESNTTLQQLDLNALEASPIKVPAQQWTTVAGDGIVSELISAWFKWDSSLFYPFVDQQCFTKDMCTAEPNNATYCSSFLVNAICAYRSYFSNTVDIVRSRSKQDMRDQFLAESLKNFDHGTPFLPAIQGLWILFSISYLKGEDKNGSVYQFAAYGMLKRSRIEQIFPSLTDTGKRIVSKTVWGVFCLESITATNFRGTIVLPQPSIPCLFPEVSYETSSNVDLFGQPFNSASLQPPFVTGATSTFCRVAVLVSEVLAHGQGRGDNEETGFGGRADLIKRADFLAQLKTLSDALPPALRHDLNFTPATCFLRIVMNTTAHAILRPVHPEVVLDETDGTSVKAMMLKYCEHDIDLMEQYFARWTMGEFSIMAFVGLVNSGTVLLPLLSEKTAQQLFPRICKLMHNISTCVTIASYVLRGWKAALWSRKMTIPGPALPYFENQELGREELSDIPTSLVITQVPTFDNYTLREWDDGQLGFLLKKWSEMKIE
ncbi:putative C6 transcription factor [Xylaria arbuscula]|nr:putative C6 transcription factor [Xylaria arbuscula]